MKKTIIFLFLLPTILVINAQYFEWAKGTVSNNSCYSLSSKLDNTGNIIYAGGFNGTTDFDPGAGVYNLTATVEDMFIEKLGPSGNFIWAKSVGGANSQQATAIEVDNANNIYITGYFSMTSDFDPGPGVHNVTAVGLSDFFILKLDANGHFIWVKTIGGANDESGLAIVRDVSNNIYVAGNFINTLDIDPGPGITNAVSTGNVDLFIIKLDTSGTFIWSRTLGGPNTDYLSALHIDNQGNLYATGKFLAFIDVNPLGSGGVLTGGGANDEAYILKIDTANNFIWAKSMSGTGDKWTKSISTDDNGNILVVGSFIGTADLLPGPGAVNFTSAGFVDAFMEKLTPSGNFIWIKTIGGISADEGQTIISDSLGNIYIGGAFCQTVDLNPNVGINNATSVGGRDAFVLKVDSSGNYIWSLKYGAPNDDYIESMLLDEEGSIFSAGRFSSNGDFDPGPGLFTLSAGTSWDAFVQKLTQDSCSNLSMILDSLSMVTCAHSGYISMHPLNGISPYSYQWNTPAIDLDSILQPDTAGIYTITLTDGYQCQRSTSYLIGSPLNPTTFNLNPELVTNIFRPGFNTNIWLNASNDGCVPASGQLKLLIDSTITYNYASPPPDIISGDTLIWNYPPITYDSGHLYRYINVSTDTAAILGSHVYFDLTITPISGDAVPGNNTKHYSFTVVNGYDPNDKKVYPLGECLAGYVLPTQNLTYTIRFQNTGNAEAINIYVLDSLDASLDLNSVRVIGSSHPLITEVLSGNILKFKFDNIMLPDSGSNEIGSHGYVIFEINPDTGLTLGTTIENSSKIFFDYNPPILTNTVSNTIISTIPNSNNTVSQTSCLNATINGFTYSASGNYIQYLDNYLGCDSMITIDLTIISLDTSISLVGNTLSSNEPSANYQWLDCNNNFNLIPGQINQTYFLTSNGSYAVKLSANGCTDTSACFSYNLFGLLENHTVSNISISPNPTASIIFIHSQNNLENASIQFSNIEGQVMLKNENIFGTHYSMDLTSLSAGIYFLKVMDGNNSKTIKIIKN